MPNPVTKIIDANDVKNGNALTSTTRVGETKTLPPVFLNSSTGKNLDNRFDNLRFYSGDSSTDGASGPTTITCFTANPYDDGYWRSQTEDASHDPGSSNNYGDPAVVDLEFIVGFDRN